jgi:hypothetical protein
MKQVDKLYLSKFIEPKLLSDQYKPELKVVNSEVSKTTEARVVVNNPGKTEIHIDEKYQDNFFGNSSDAK